MTLFKTTPPKYFNMLALKKREELQQRICDYQTLVIRQIASTRAMQMSDYRFLDNPRVTVQALVRSLSGQCQSALVPGQHYLALQDTSDIKLPSLLSTLVFFLEWKSVAATRYSSFFA